MSLIWINGQWHDRETATVSVYDHGLLYGDGVFEGMRVYGGRTFRLQEHLDRLYDSAQAIWITVPMSKDEMARVTEEGIARAKITEGYLRHVVTRGTGDLGLDPRSCARPTVFIIFDAIRIWPAERYEKGLAMISAGTPMPDRESLSPRVKSLNYLPHIMAKLEGIHAQMDEVLMLDRGGYVAEASGMNVFIVKRGVVTTPPAWTGVLRGVTRDIVLGLAGGRRADRAGGADQPLRRLHRRRGVPHRDGGGNRPDSFARRAPDRRRPRRAGHADPHGPLPGAHPRVSRRP